MGEKKAIEWITIFTTKNFHMVNGAKTTSETDSSVHSEDTVYSEAGSSTRFQSRKETLPGQPKSFDSFIEEARNGVPQDFSDETHRPGRNANQ